jgi:hypothetical protein
MLRQLTVRSGVNRKTAGRWDFSEFLTILKLAAGPEELEALKLLGREQNSMVGYRRRAPRWPFLVRGS